MTIHCKITEAGVTRKFSIDDADDPHAGWRLLFAFIAKCEGNKDYKEIGRRKAAESEAILKAAKAAKTGEVKCTLASSGSTTSSMSASQERRERSRFL